MKFSNIPKHLVATCIIFIFIVIIFIYDPPKDICDSQKEFFIESQKGILFPKVIDNYPVAPRIGKYVKLCKIGNDAGSCLELFTHLRKIVIDINNTPSKCNEKINKIPEVNKVLWGSLKLMTFIAWGENGPKEIKQKFGWLDFIGISLFCDLKNIATKFYGKRKWYEFYQNINNTLPNANSLSKKEVWNRSILSTRCEIYN